MTVLIDILLGGERFSGREGRGENFCFREGEVYSQALPGNKHIPHGFFFLGGEYFVSIWMGDIFLPGGRIFFPGWAWQQKAHSWTSFLEGDTFLSFFGGGCWLDREWEFFKRHVNNINVITRFLYTFDMFNFYILLYHFLYTVRL